MKLLRCPAVLLLFLLPTACTSPARDQAEEITLEGLVRLSVDQKDPEVGYTYSRPTQEALSAVTLPRPAPEARVTMALLAETLGEHGFRTRTVLEEPLVILIERVADEQAP